MKIKKGEKEVKPVSNESWDIEPIENVDGLQQVIEQYSSEIQKGMRKKGASSDDNKPKRSYKASVQLSNETEIRDFFEELISFLGKIPPLIQVRKNETTINVDNGNNMYSDDPNNPPESGGPNYQINNVVNIDININVKK
ncbi:MAG: hypothetical protein II886_04870 [Prevotella sp.]|nr:hypothetical protein [Prevotella sp.]